MPPGAGAVEKNKLSQGTWQWIGIASLAAGSLGLVLPWVSVLIFSVSGLDTGDGKLYGGMLVAAAICFWLWRRNSTKALGVVALIVAFGMIGLAVYDVINVSSIHGALGISVSPGAGLLLDLAAAIALAVSILMLLNWKEPHPQVDPPSQIG